MIALITKFIPLPWLLGGLALALAALTGWALISQAKMETAQADARAEKIRADANTAAYLSLAALATKQNTAILELEAAGKLREEIAKQAGQEAAQAAKPHEERVTHYLGLKTPTNGQCAAAGDLANAYFKTRAAAAVDSVRH